MKLLSEPISTNLNSLLLESNQYIELILDAIDQIIVKGQTSTCICVIILL